MRRKKAPGEEAFKFFVCPVCSLAIGDRRNKRTELGN
jgi:hypothetical protein